MVPFDNFSTVYFRPLRLFPDPEKLGERGKVIAFWLAVMAGGLMRWYLPKHGFTWFDLYQSSWSNFDAFFGGMLLCGLTRDAGDGKWKKILRYLSVVAALSFVLTDAYFISHGLHLKAREFRYPTVYLLLISLILFAFDTKDRIKSTPLTFESFRQNPFRIFDFLAGIRYIVRYVSRSRLSVNSLPTSVQCSELASAIILCAFVDMLKLSVDCVGFLYGAFVP